MDGRDACKASSTGEQVHWSGGNLHTVLEMRDGRSKHTRLLRIMRRSINQRPRVTHHTDGACVCGWHSTNSTELYLHFPMFSCLFGLGV